MMADHGSLDLPRPTATAGSGEPASKRDNAAASTPGAVTKKKGRASRDAAAIKRRCVSTACIACRKRKSKCDGNTPSCAACSSVYGTECIYDPGSDHRRKGVYKDKTETLKARESTLQTIVQAVRNYDEGDDLNRLVARIRSADSLDEVADDIIRKQMGEDVDDDGSYDSTEPANPDKAATTFENELSGKMGELRMENGQVTFIGGTSNLIYLTPERPDDSHIAGLPSDMMHTHHPNAEAAYRSWTTVTQDPELILHLLNMYLCWHYPFFTCLSKSLFVEDFSKGRQPPCSTRPSHASSLLVNAMLALGCHFTSRQGACANHNDAATKGDHFFAEAKRLIVENDEYEKPRLTTVQALALMSVREAGCGREAKGWVYSGMSFRMALDMGLNLDITTNRDSNSLGEKEVDARRVTFWGTFLFDKCWSNYLGRLPQLPTSNITCPKIEVFPDEDGDVWAPFNDQGMVEMHRQPARTRAVALQITALCEISSDLLSFFYHPTALEKPMGKGVELKRLGELHTRLESWRSNLPKEFEVREGQLPNVLLMHMFNHLLYIHLFRPFLKYSPSTSPLPTHVSPRKLCTAAAAAISKLMRLYKRTYGLRQICNIAVYIVHSACTIHLLNLPLADVKSECALDTEGNGMDGKGKATSASQMVGKAASRDIVHGVKHLEEIAEDWLCSRRTLSILSVLARKWKISLPEEASIVLERADRKYGTFSTGASPEESPRDQYEGRYEGPQRASPFGPRADEAVEFGGHGGAGLDRGRYGGTSVGDIVHDGFPDNGYSLQQQGLTQHSSPYETQLSTPIMAQGMMQQQPPSPFAPDTQAQGQFGNFMRFSPNRMSSGMQNPTYPNILHNSSQHQMNQQGTPMSIPQIQQSLPPFSQSQQFQHQQAYHPGHSRAISNISATSTPHTPLAPNFASLTPGIQSVHGTPVSRPASMFGQVEALGAADVTSQDWWLRDQAQIAVGFEGWQGGIAGSGPGLGEIAEPQISTPGLDNLSVRGPVRFGGGMEELNGRREEMGNAYMTANRSAPRVGDVYGGNGNGNTDGHGGNGNGNNSGNNSGNPSPGMGGWY